MRALGIIVLLALWGCSKQPSDDSYDISVEEVDLEWSYPDDNEVSITLLLRNNGENPVEGEAEITGELDLKKLEVFKLASEIHSRGVDEDAFKAQIETELASGAKLTELSKAIVVLFDEGKIETPTRTVLEIPLDDEDTGTFEFRADVDVEIRPLRTQEVEFEVKIPSQYSHRRAKFTVTDIIDKANKAQK